MPTATVTPIPTAQPTTVPTATPDVQATIEAGVEATKTAEVEIEATIEARVAATKAAELPPNTPEPTPPSDDEKLVRDFFECLEGNLAVAGAFTSQYDGPLSEQVQTVLNGAGDVTELMHDYGLFESAMLVAIKAEPAVGLAVRAINFGCSLIGSDDPSETPEPENTPTPTPDDTTEVSKCEELAPKIIELSQDKDPSDDPISEITGIEEISSGLFGIECKGLSHTVSGEAKWIKFFQKPIGGHGYETLKPGDYECEYLVPQIIQLSQGRDQEILEILDIQELQQSDDEIVCSGTATLPQRESLIEFWLETKEDEDEPGLTYGYEFVVNN